MERYYVKRPTGKVFGPFDENAIRLMLKGNKLGADAQVSSDKEAWKPISQIAAFADVLGNKTKGGVGGGSASLPVSANGGPNLPQSKSNSGPPDLPRSKGGGPSLPTPKSKGPDLPASKSKVPDLPVPKSTGADLPASKSAGADLPASKSAGADLPAAKADGNLPRSGQDNLPRSGQDNLPRSGQDNLPQSQLDSPAPAAPPEDDDLFGAPIDDDDLFDDGLDEDSDDLFGAPDGLDEDSDDLFGAPDGLDEDSDDLFGAPGGLDEDSDDLFGDADEEDPLEDDDDLFDAPEMEDDDLFSDAPADDDDFLGGDQGFSFLDDESEGDDDDLEDWEEELGDDSFDPDDIGSSEEDDWGDDLLDDEPAPSRQPASSGASPDTDDRFRPASRGISVDESPEPAQTTQEETVDADKQRGMMTLISVAAVAVILFGGAGYGIFQALQSDDDADTVIDEGPQAVELSLDEIRSDNYNDLLRIIEAASTGEPDSINQGRLLLAKSLYLTRYEDESLAERASALASELAGQEDEPTIAIGLAAHEARLAEPDAAVAFAEAIADDPELGYFAHLTMGIADATAHFEDRDFSQTLQVDEEPDDSDFDEELADEEMEPQEEPEDEDEADSDDESEISEEEEEQQEEERRVLQLADRAAAHFHAAAEANGESAPPHYWLARLAIHLEDSDEALDHLERAINAQPSHVASRLQAGQIYYQQGDLNDAAEHLQEINDVLTDRASDGERGEALHLMGMVHQARQESEEAIEMFTRALGTDSSRRDSLRALGGEYERAEMYEEALNFFSTDENLGQEDPDVILGIVRSHMGLEQWSTAIRELESGEEQFPEDARFPYNLGILNEERGNFREAREAYERALEIDPAILPAHASLAQLSWRLDSDVTQGQQHVQAIIDRADLIDASIAAEVAEYYHMSNRPILAQNWNEEALRIDPNFWEARLALARIYLDENQTADALELLERSRDEGVQDLQLSAYLADGYRQDGQFDRAIEEINSVIAEDPDDKEYIFIRGLIYFDRGNYATAREDFSNAYDIDPQFHDAYFYVGRTALAEGDYTTATRIFRHVLDYQPDNGVVHYFMGRTFEKENSITQALDSYRNAVNSDPDFVEETPDVLVRRGRLYAELGRPGLAQADLERAIELAPDDPDALMSIASLNFQNSNYEAAIESYEQALEVNPEHPNAQYELGMAYIYQNEDQDGARHLQLAVRYGYDDPEIYRTMGYLYRELGQRSDALDSFKRYLRESDEDQVADSTRREMLRQIQELGG